MRFMGTPVHADDLADAKVGGKYFVVKEARRYWKPTAPSRARLQTLPPERLGAVDGLAESSPRITRKLLGMAKVVRRGSEKMLLPLAEQEVAEATARAALRLAKQQERAAARELDS